MRHLARLAAAVACLLLAAVPAFAQAIADIRIEGAQRVDTETVRSYLQVRPGEAFTDAKLDESLKALFATGYFADVNLRREGSVLYVRVTENPIINRIQFEGNRKIEDKALTNEVQSRPRVVYTRTRVQADVKRILELYRRSGRFAATVEPKIIQLPQNRVDLVFEINEGATTNVDQIVFIGNKRFSDGQLRSVIQTEESRWYRFFSSDDVYDPDRIAYDRELLRKYYLAQGYADFRVVSAVAELNTDRTGFVVTFTVEEGPRYHFGKIDVTSRLQELRVEQLRALVKTQDAEWYNAEQVEKTIEALTDEVGRYGYAFVDVRPRVNRDREKLLVDVTYEIGEGPRVYVDRIDIEGNTRTLDKVIRREFRLQEGDAFNTAKLRRTRQRLRNLGFFEKVEVNNVPADQPDRTTIKVEVEEKSTGEISLGAGFSSSQGALADIGLRERNFLGRGQDIRVGVAASQKRQQIDGSFTEPYFLDRNIAAGVDAFKIIRDLTDESSFKLDTQGFSLRGGYRLTENLRQNFKYTFKQDSLEAGSDASRFVRAENGKTITSSIAQELVYDRRDNRFDPTEGYFISFGAEAAGAGGDEKFVRTTLRGSYYLPVLDQVVLGVGGKGGYAVGLGQGLRLNERFFVGGEDFRGFRLGGIGARDTSTDSALGANYYAVGTAEMSFPLGLPKEFNIKGRIFTDIGLAGGSDDSGPELSVSDALRATVGVGFSYASPFGPIRVDIGQPIVKQNFDKVERFLFSFGTRF